MNFTVLEKERRLPRHVVSVFLYIFNEQPNNQSYSKSTNLFVSESVGPDDADLKDCMTVWRVSS